MTTKEIPAKSAKRKEAPVHRSITGAFPVAVTVIETPQAGSEAHRRQEWFQLSPAAAEPAPAQAYDQEAFRYLLSIEHKRSERTGRSYLLLLVELQDYRVVSPPIDSVVAAALFAGLRLALRDTDVVGWYVADRVAGAVLTDLGDGSLANTCRVIRQTVTGILRELMPPAVGARLQVRIYASQGPRRIGTDAH